MTELEHELNVTMAFAMANALLENPCVSDWLKNAIGELAGRDPVDAMGDALALASWARLRAGLQPQA